MYRVTLEEKQVVSIDSDTGKPYDQPQQTWVTQATVQGGPEVVAGALRAMADKISPPKPAMRGYE